jgi:hypothetical protein
MELDVTVSQKIDLAHVSAIVTISTNDCVLCISNSSKLKQSLVELGQPWEVVRANIHVVELECHSALFRLGYEPHSTKPMRIEAALVEVSIFFSA